MSKLRRIRKIDRKIVSKVSTWRNGVLVESSRSTESPKAKEVLFEYRKKMVTVFVLDALDFEWIPVARISREDFADIMKLARRPGLPKKR